MQPDPPQPGFPQHGQPPVAGGPAPWGGGPSPSAAPPGRRANATAAMIAGILALLTAGMLLSFALCNVVYATGQTGRLSSGLLVNVFGGVVSAGSLLVPAGFTFARRIAGAWTLCGLCAFYVVASIFAAPLLWGTAFSAQFKFIFGFGGVDDAAVGLAVIFGVLTAIMAAIAGGMKSNGPTTVGPPHP